MKFSIITPEHNKQNQTYLLELYESIKAQTYTNWEWVLYANNGYTKNDVPDIIKSDSRVIIHEFVGNNTSIGFLKNNAFRLGAGDILVEADHDDILTPDCLQELYEVYANEPDVGFVYSDNAVLDMKHDFIPYRKDHGWKYREFQYKGRILAAMESFEPSSHSLCQIWYAPDHVRSWRKEVYYNAGGHNPTLHICDDHELCIKTYLVTRMKRIPKVLYIYRNTGDNTYLKRSRDIEIKTNELFNEYTRKLAEKDTREAGLLCVDIGGGINPHPGYLQIDQRDGVDIQYDLNDGIPLPDNSVGVLNASHIIEHLHDKTKIMKEIHRVLVPGGWAFIEVPSTDGRGAFQDPTHVSYWNENSFLYYTDAYLANFIDNRDIRFQTYRLETWFPNDWMKQMKVCVTTAWLVAVKPGMPRLPGELKI